MNETMIKTNEVLLKDCNKWLYFANPYRLISAEHLDEVAPALHEMERLVKVNEWYAAGFLSYEAASAFDPALQTRASSALQTARFVCAPRQALVAPLSAKR